MVRLEGLEPPVSRFVAAHSIQLSYRRLSHQLMPKYNSMYNFKMQVLFFAFFNIVLFAFRAVRTHGASARP